MPLTIDRLTSVISVPQSYTTHIVGTLYELDTDKFRLDLKALEAAEAGIVEADTHAHNTEVTIAGTVYARAIEMLSPYSVKFTPDAQWSVRLAGSNNNIFDVENSILVQNQVQVIPGNSAGLVVVTQGSGVTEQDKLDIADRVWDEALDEHVDAGTAGKALDDIEPGVSAADVADAVWNEGRDTHTGPDTFGAVDEWTAVVDEEAIADAVWDEQRSEHVDTGSYGKTDEWVNTVDTDELADAVWDEARVDHTDPDTFGAVDEWAGEIDAEAIADAVWDEPSADHTDAGSFGVAVLDAGGAETGLHVSMQDNGTTATFSVWMELDGSPRTDLDSMTVKVLNSLGAVIKDLGLGTCGSNAVFRWTLASSTLTAKTSYVLMVTAAKGADTWIFNRGFAKA